MNITVIYTQHERHVESQTAWFNVNNHNGQRYAIHNIPPFQYNNNKITENQNKRNVLMLNK